MKKYLNIIIILLIVFLILSGYYILTQQSVWETYTNTNSLFSFSYPISWGEPRVYENKDGTEFGVSFEKYAFSINNGYYFSDVENKRPTVSQLVQYYKTDMDSKNEVKDFQTEDIKVDGHSAIKVTVNTLVDTHYTDVYIYEDQQNQDKFILITANRNLVDDKTFDSILSTFKFIK